MKFWEELGYENISSTEQFFTETSDLLLLESYQLDASLLKQDGDIECFAIDWDAGLESVGDRVKEMASKAKANVKLYAKKLINFFFGWMIRFLKGSTDVRKVMGQHYKKAKELMTNLNKMEQRVYAYNGDKTIEIQNYGKRFGISVIGIQTSTWILQHLVKDMEQTQDRSNPLHILLQHMNSLSESITVWEMMMEKAHTKPLQVLEQVDYSVRKLIEAAQQSLTKRSDVTKTKLSEDPEKQAQALEITSDLLNETNSRMKNMDKIKEELKDSKSEESVKEAFQQCRTWVKFFLSIGKANDWNFEKAASSARKTHTQLQKAIDDLDVKEMPEKQTKLVLKSVVMIGNIIGKIKNISEVLIRGINDDMSKLFTEVTKIGSITYRMTGNNE